MGEYRIATDKLAELLENDSTALIVVDKQKGYIENSQPLLSTLHTNADKLAATVPMIDDFIEKARRTGVHIVWTQMVEDRKESVPSIARKIQLEGSSSFIEPGHESFQFYGRAVPIDGEAVFKKKSYDAFSTTELDEYLKKQQIKTIVLVGAYTSRCILSTAFVASGLAYNVFVAKDLVGVPEKFMHEEPVALGIIDSILGYVVNSEFLLQTWTH